MPTKTNSIAKQRTKRTKKQNQTGGWFWEESDPITGGLVRGIKSAVSNLKPSQITDFGSNFIPVLGNVSRGLKMVGMGEAYNITRAGVKPKPERDGVVPKPQRDSVYMGRPEIIPRIPIPRDELRVAIADRVADRASRLAEQKSDNVKRDTFNKLKQYTELMKNRSQMRANDPQSGTGKRGSRIQRGGSVAQLTPNSNSYGGIKF